MTWSRRASHIDASVRSRGVSLAAAIGVHAGLFALLLMPTSIQSSRPADRPLAVFQLSGEAAKPSIPKPPQPVPVKPVVRQIIVMPPPIVPLPAPSPAIVAMLETAAAQTGGACDLTMPVQEALRSNPQVMDILRTVPRADRSVANAIMIWQSSWAPFADAKDDMARDFVRDAIAGVVASASEECRLQAQSGPRLLVLPDTSETLVLALGSGAWRWQDLLDTARPDGWVLQAPADAPLPPDRQPQSVAHLSASVPQVAER